MGLPLIEARALGKEFRLGGASGPYRTLRESITDMVKAPARLFRRGGAKDTAFWALRDVNFDIGRGEAVGIIGRNGAGKSTLLKILSRVTAPSAGEVRLRGQLASLLEVGTGFHPELTGRENIFLNGAIMGMTRAQVRAKFDEIVAFAELEKFVDTPVKRYSSGMYTRLGFAVAAHLEPDVLVVDEVLAVGDASFQKKCLGKMESVASGGRTVLFVSHNMASVTRLCQRAILLKNGQVAADGPVGAVVSAYMGGALGESPTAVNLEREGRAPGNEHVRLLAARVRCEGMQSSVVDIRNPIEIEVDFEVLKEQFPLHPNIYFFNEDGVCAFVTSDVAFERHRVPRPPGRYRSLLTVPGNFLGEGMYSLDVYISTMDPVMVHVTQKGLLAFQVNDPGGGDTVRGNYAGPYPGAIRPLLPWVTGPLP